MIEHDKKATFIIVAVVFAVIIIIPILMYTQKFEADERSVWFSIEGIPHCPYCYRIVEPFTGFCKAPDCKKHFRWMDKQTVCWHCGGQKVCPVCRGSAHYPYWYMESVESQAECYDCFDPSEKVARPTGKCQMCCDGELTGFNIWGASSIQHDSLRP